MVEPGTLLVRMREFVRADEHARMHASVFVIRAHLFEARWYSRIRMRAQIECVLLLFFQASSTLECVFLQACLYLLTYLNPFPCLPPIHHSPHPPSSSPAQPHPRLQSSSSTTTLRSAGSEWPHELTILRSHLAVVLKRLRHIVRR